MSRRTSPWIPSHQDLGRHPKTRKAARKAGVSLPTMVGHLHLLWHWALELAPDGDLSRFGDDDLADAAMWDGDPETFVAALTDCGPGDQAGFLEPDRQLHDWDDYGGRYHKRVAAAKKGAEARWSDADAEREQTDGDATAMPPQYDRNANAEPPHSDSSANRNAEERRGEENSPEGNGSPPFEKRLADELRSDHDWEYDATGTLYEAFHELLSAALERLPDHRHHGTSMGVIARYVERCTGMKLTKPARDHTANLVRNHSPTAVLRGYGEAVNWGAGVSPEYADDPLALSRYVAGVLSGEKRGAA